MKKAYSRPRLTQYGTVNHLGEIFGKTVNPDAILDPKKTIQPPVQDAAGEARAT
jgi:hypothetical protein